MWWYLLFILDMCAACMIITWGLSMGFRDLSCDLDGGLLYTKWPLDVRSLGHRDAIVRDSVPCALFCVRANVLPYEFWTLLDKTLDELTCLQVWNRWLGSWSHRLVIKLQRRFTPLLKHMPWSEAHHGWRPPKIYGVLKLNSPKKLIKTAQDLVVFV